MEREEENITPEQILKFEARESLFRVVVSSQVTGFDRSGVQESRRTGESVFQTEREIVCCWPTMAELTEQETPVIHGAETYESLSSLLCNDQRDFLIRNDGQKVWFLFLFLYSNCGFVHSSRKLHL